MSPFASEPTFLQVTASNSPSPSVSANNELEMGGVLPFWPGRPSGGESSTYGSDTVVRARSVAGDRLLPTSKWHLHNWRPGPDDFAFFPEKEHLDVHRLAPAVLVGEL